MDSIHFDTTGGQHRCITRSTVTILSRTTANTAISLAATVSWLDHTAKQPSSSLAAKQTQVNRVSLGRTEERAEEETGEDTYPRDTS